VLSLFLAGLISKLLPETRESIYSTMFLINLLSLVVIEVVGVGRFGATPLKWCFGLKVVLPDGRRVGYWRSLVRLVGLFPLLLLVPIVGVLEAAGVPTKGPVMGAVYGLFWALQIGVLAVSAALIVFGKRRRGLHDWLADTVVLQLPGKRRNRIRRTPPTRSST
jgi:uncharacterized RDD family membrane protein YckC